MIPPSLLANPSLDRWIAFPVRGKVRVGFGKVEYGQGVATALAQIAADELDVAFDRVVIAETATDSVPDEGLTVGSMSIESSGASLRAASAEVRSLFVAEAASRLGCRVEELDIDDGEVVRGGSPTGLDYWDLADAVDLARPPEGKVRWKTHERHTVVGRSQPRVDLPAKLFGGGFITDLSAPDMIHARVVRQPGPSARLVAFDEAALRRSAGEDLDVLVDAAFVAILSKSERAVDLALAAAQGRVQWIDGRTTSAAQSEPASLKELPRETWREGPAAAGPSNRRRHHATYSRPYIAHGSIGPACGLARYDGVSMTVWAHSQGVYPLRQMVARITGLEPANIHVIHLEAAGCYGHNGADDAACDAAAIALRRPGSTIRVQWRREDEFGFAPVGTAMRIELAGELDAAGALVDFTTEIWSGPHVGRGRALVESALAPGRPAKRPPPIPGFSGGRLNAAPSYDIAAKRIAEHVVEPPVRTSSLRGLGGPVNTYACESFVDELAEIAGDDPLAWRLAMTADPRARTVLSCLGELAAWSGRGPAGTGRGLGLAYCRHRDRGAYVAVAVALAATDQVRLEAMWCAADCGLVINPDGARNQIEGGMIMAASWALKEQVRLADQGISSLTWADYPILRFDEVPPVEVELIDQAGAAPLGVGEVSLGPTLAAIGNALAHALGQRIRDLPFTREKIAAALLAS